MFTETLFGNTQELLALLESSQLLQEAYLAGGTAAALQLGHRISVDLDFFTSKEFDAKKSAAAFKRALGRRFTAEQLSRGTIKGHFKEVRFSLFAYDYPVLFPFKKFNRTNLLDLRDIAAMKAAAISDRGTKRDFIDLYFICQQGLSLARILMFYDRKYGKLEANRIHIQKSLVYFADAEKEEMPRMLKEISWREIRKFFEIEITKMSGF